MKEASRGLLAAENAARCICSSVGAAYDPITSVSAAYDLITSPRGEQCGNARQSIVASNYLDDMFCKDVSYLSVKAVVVFNRALHDC